VITLSNFFFIYIDGKEEKKFKKVFFLTGSNIERSEKSFWLLSLFIKKI
jgi:hypothetical protein